MDTTQLWQLFLETGAPEVYMLYAKAMKSEGVHVSDGSGSGTAGYGLQ